MTDDQDERERDDQASASGAPVHVLRRVPAPDFTEPAPHGLIRDWTWRDTVKVVAVVAAAALFLVPVGVLLAKSRADAAVAAQQAGEYVAPPLAASSGAQYTGPVVAIVGDETVVRSVSSVGKADRWPALIGTSLDSAVDLIDVDGGGYATTGTDGVTFLNGAAALASDADVVLFVGGSNDANVSPTSLARSVTNSMSAAAERSPGATVAIVGPIVTDGLDAQRLTALRGVLRSAAGTANVLYVDPSAWLSTPKAKAVDLTAADERTIASKMEAIVQRLAR